MSFSDIEVVEGLEFSVAENWKESRPAVCGGTALNALGLVQRTTADIDVVGFAEEVEDQIVVSRAEFPDWLLDSAGKVARDMGLPKDLDKQRADIIS